MKNHGSAVQDNAEVPILCDPNSPNLMILSPHVFQFKCNWFVSHAPIDKYMAWQIMAPWHRTIHVTNHYLANDDHHWSHELPWLFNPLNIILINPMLPLFQMWTIEFSLLVVKQGWGQIRFIKYKYKYKNLDFSNTNTNILFNIDSNTNTNADTSIQIQMQIQIRSTKYIFRNCSDPKQGNSMNPKIYAHGLCFLMFRWHLKLINPFAFQEISLALEQLGEEGGRGTRVLERDAKCHPLTRNAIKGQKGGWNYTFLQIFTKNRCRNTIFLFFLKYKGQNYSKFSRDLKK